MSQHYPIPILSKTGEFLGTQGSKELMERMLERTGGRAILAFSRGKDSLASWLYLRDCGFTDIIPYAMISTPGLEFVDKSLRYYEEVFGVKIRRIMQGGNIWNLKHLYFQPPCDEELIKQQNFQDYHHAETVSLIAEELDWTDYWYAHGMSMFDKITRMKFIQDAKGFHPKHRRFNPCWDWRKPQVVQYIYQSGVSLPLDYLLDECSHELMGGAGAAGLFNMLQIFPEDFARLETLFPFIRVKMIREEILDEKRLQQKWTEENLHWISGKRKRKTTLTDTLKKLLGKGVILPSDSADKPTENPV